MLSAMPNPGLEPPQPAILLTAECRSLVMANYAIDPAALEPYLPRGVELDLWQVRRW